MSDIVKDLTNYRIKGIEKAEVEFYESLTKTLDKIEDQIVALADVNLPSCVGSLPARDTTSRSILSNVATNDL